MKKTNGIKPLPKRLKGTSAFLDRHGKPRWRYRKKGMPTIYLKGEPGSVEFVKSYAKAVDGIKDTVTEGHYRKKRTMAHLINQYLQSYAFLSLAKSTKQGHRLRFKYIKKNFGDRYVAGLTRKHVVKIHQAKANTPNEANHVLQRIKQLLDLAVELEWITENPSRSIRKFRIKSDGHHAWTEEEIGKYLECHKAKSKERLALYLLLYTAQRGIDVAPMGWQHVKDGVIRVKQIKTGEWLWIPIHPTLRNELENWKNNLTFVVNRDGATYSTKGFQHWFAKSARIAGLEGCTAHGLRKAASRRLADCGATNKQIMSITGHKTSSEVDRYTRDANQKRLAKAAMHLIEK